MSKTVETLTEQQKKARQALQGKIKGKVLYLGCRDKDYLGRPKGTFFCAVDICEEKVRTFQKTGKDAKCVCADAVALPFKRTCFESVTMVDLIHHLAGKNMKETEENVRWCLNECMRVDNEKGRIVIIETFVNHGFAIIERLTYKIIRFLLPYCSLN